MPTRNPLEEAIERVQRYLALHTQISNADHEKLHVIAIGGAPAELLASDLQELLACATDVRDQRAEAQSVQRHTERGEGQ